MQFSVHYSLCGCDARIENETLCHEPGISAPFSHIREISGGENLLRKSDWAMKISRNPRKYLP